MIAETKAPYPRRLEGRALAGSTRSCHFATTRPQPLRAMPKEVGGKRVKREACLTKQAKLQRKPSEDAARSRLQPLEGLLVTLRNIAVNRSVDRKAPPFDFRLPTSRLVLFRRSWRIIYFSRNSVTLIEDE